MATPNRFLNGFPTQHNKKASLAHRVGTHVLKSAGPQQGRRYRCCGREALRDKEGEGMRCQETKHSMGENVRIVRHAALDGGRGSRRRCYGREALRDKEGEGTRCQETKSSVG